MLVLTPVIAAISVYSHFVTERGDPWGKSIDAIASWKVDSKWLQPAPLHLWFLEYLMLYCAVATLLLPRIEGFLPKLDSWTWAIVNSRFRLAVLAMPTAISLWMMPAGMARYPDSLVPALDLIVMYGWFYVVGWLIYRRRDLLTLLASRAKAEVLTCPLFVVCALLLLMARGILGIEVKARSLTSQSHFPSVYLSGHSYYSCFQQRCS